MSPFDHVIGNELAKQYLSRIIANSTFGNLLLFAGPDGIGKSLFAEAFARCLLTKDSTASHTISEGNHPDIRTYRPEGKLGMHSIESMRQFNEEVYLQPYCSKWKIFIVHDAERMLTYSSNALLKTFEEPLSTSLIILLTSHPEAILPTITSRCSTLRFHLLKDTEVSLLLQKQYQKGKEEADKIAQLAKGSIGRACSLMNEDKNPIRNTVLDILIHRKMASYHHLLSAIKTVSESIEQSQKGLSDSLHTALSERYQNDPNRVQQEAIDKEIEGVLATKLAQEADLIFELILSWYRDMHLLHVGGNKAFLCLPDHADAVDHALQCGQLFPLEKVIPAISEARLSLERSTPLSHCLENLFLQLA